MTQTTVSGWCRVKLNFKGLKLLVVGDPIYDIYHFGRVDRMSPEAPVPVFVEERIERRAGGAWNVAAQLDALGCQVDVSFPFDTDMTEKHRYMVASHQLLRVDFDRCCPSDLPALEGFHAIVISDYAKGACTPEVCQEVIASGLPVIVDPKGSDWRKYEGAHIICPNDAEYVAWHRNGWTPPVIVHKRGAQGIDLHIEGIAPGYEHTHYPATAQHVADVTGCGDAVVAVIAACHAGAVPYGRACTIANLAAGWCAGEVGTTVCPLDVLQKLCAGVA